MAKAPARKPTDGAPAAPTARIRDRIKDLRRVPASLLKANPANWKKHPKKQRDQLEQLLSRIGFAGACLARELEDGSLELLDGHLRADMSAGEIVPVLVLDVNELEAKEILATFDPLGTMAETNDVMLDALLADLNSQENDLAGLLAEAQEPDVELKQLSAKSPPKLAWALIAIPVTRFGEISELIEKIAEVNGATVETCISD